MPLRLVNIINNKFLKKLKYNHYARNSFINFIKISDLIKQIINSLKNALAVMHMQQHPLFRVRVSPAKCFQSVMARYMPWAIPYLSRRTGPLNAGASTEAQQASAQPRPSAHPTGIGNRQTGMGIQARVGTPPAPAPSPRPGAPLRCAAPPAGFKAYKSYLLGATSKQFSPIGC
jgi:hypothetical protein